MPRVRALIRDAVHDGIVLGCCLSVLMYAWLGFFAPRRVVHSADVLYVREMYRREVVHTQRKANAIAALLDSVQQQRARMDDPYTYAAGGH